MSIWERIQESVMNKYNETYGKANSIQKKLDKGKSITIDGPTSMRTFTKDPKTGDYGNMEIGDESNDYDKKAVGIMSTAIRNVKYDPKTNTATLTFASGGHPYDYEVTPEEFMDFINAPSKGRHVATLWNHNPHFSKL